MWAVDHAGHDRRFVKEAAQHGAGHRRRALTWRPRWRRRRSSGGARRGSARRPSRPAPPAPWPRPAIAATAAARRAAVALAVGGGTPLQRLVAASATGFVLLCLLTDKSGRVYLGQLQLPAVALRRCSRGSTSAAVLAAGSGRSWQYVPLQGALPKEERANGIASRLLVRHDAATAEAPGGHRLLVSVRRARVPAVAAADGAQLAPLPSHANGNLSTTRVLFRFFYDGYEHHKSQGNVVLNQPLSKLEADTGSCPSVASEVVPVIEQHACPFCLLLCGFFQSLEHHLRACHDLFHFAFHPDACPPRVDVICAQPYHHKVCSGPTTLPDSLSPDALTRGSNSVGATADPCMFAPRVAVLTEAAAATTRACSRPAQVATRSLPLQPFVLWSGRQKRASLERRAPAGPAVPREEQWRQLQVALSSAALLSSSVASMPSIMPPSLPLKARLSASAYKARRGNAPCTASKQRLQSRTFYHSRSAQPLSISELLSDQDSEDDMDEEVADLESARRLDEFDDVVAEEKEVMYLWNSFVRRQRMFADLHCEWACQAFARQHATHFASRPSLRSGHVASSTIRQAPALEDWLLAFTTNHKFHETAVVEILQLAKHQDIRKPKGQQLGVCMINHTAMMLRKEGNPAAVRVEKTWESVVMPRKEDSFLANAASSSPAAYCRPTARFPVDLTDGDPSAARSDLLLMSTSAAAFSASSLSSACAGETSPA
eukprot:SM000085S23194  [mRNA]  locus=s85:44517:53307:+ [translate_table: standard]